MRVIPGFVSVLLLLLMSAWTAPSHALTVAQQAIPNNEGSRARPTAEPQTRPSDTQAPPQRREQPRPGILSRPLMERYILDELKSLRTQQERFKADLEKRLANTQLEVSDRALRYSSDTMNNIFILITGTVSILVFVGWNSLRDIKSKMEDLVNNKVDDITVEYRNRLHDVEETFRKRTEEIIARQEEISRNNQQQQEEIAKTNTIHSLWMRVGLETNIQQKINIYDEILAIDREDAEAFAYKADAVLELGEAEWAINLCNKAIQVDPDYGYAYWQLACAHAEAENQQYALDNLATALEKSPQLINDIESETSFDSLRELEGYKALLGASTATTTAA